jgi:hypothetical protein
LFAGEEEKRKREKWWAVAAGKREGEVSRVRVGNDGHPYDASDIRLEAFPIIKSSPRVNIFGESLPLGFR